MDKKYCGGCDEQDIDQLPPCPLQCKSSKCKAYQNKSRIDPDIRPIVWVLGGPGSGKLTQCKKIVATYGFTHLSTGDLLRAEIDTGSDRAKCLSSIMERGELVPNDIVLTLLREAMEAQADTAQGFLVDGYPREKSQGAEFERFIGKVACILYFEASFDTLSQRLLVRAETSGRKDDNIDVIKLRLMTFLEHNAKVIDKYEDRVSRFDAELSPDEIFAQVQAVMDPIVQRARALKAARAAAAEAALKEARAAFARSSTAIARSSMLLGRPSAANLRQASMLRAAPGNRSSILNPLGALSGAAIAGVKPLAKPAAKPTPSDKQTSAAKASSAGRPTSAGKPTSATKPTSVGKLTSTAKPTSDTKKP